MLGGVGARPPAEASLCPAGLVQGFLPLPLPCCQFLKNLSRDLYRLFMRVVPLLLVHDPQAYGGWEACVGLSTSAVCGDLRMLPAFLLR